MSWAHRPFSWDARLEPTHFPNVKQFMLSCVKCRGWYGKFPEREILCQQCPRQADFLSLRRILRLSASRVLLLRWVYILALGQLALSSQPRVWLIEPPNLPTTARFYHSHLVAKVFYDDGSKFEDSTKNERQDKFSGLEFFLWGYHRLHYSTRVRIRFYERSNTALAWRNSEGATNNISW